jgi:acyl carrier protein
VNTLERVRHIIADLFQRPVAQITPATSPDSLAGWDSLQHLNLVLALEQEFALQFAPEEIEQMLSVELIADLIEEKLSAATLH